MKKTLLFTLLIIVCIALVSCSGLNVSENGEDSNTNGTNVATTIKDPEVLPPISVDFDTIEDIAEFVVMASGPIEEYNYYIKERSFNSSFWSPQYTYAKELAENISTVLFPVPKNNIENYTINIDFIPEYNRLQIIYGKDEFIKYRFIYYFNAELSSSHEGVPVLKDVKLGNVTLDIYKNDASWFVGEAMMGNAAFTAIAPRAETIEEVDFNYFDYLPISEIEPKGYRHPDLQYLDVHQTYKPTYEEVISITKGMSVKEVIDKIGKPHDIEQSSGRLRRFEWTTKDENTFKVFFSYSWIPEDAMDMSETEKLMTYGVVVSVELPKEYVQSRRDPSVTAVPETTRVPPTVMPRETLSVTG